MAEWSIKASDLVRGWPEPWTTVCTASLLPAFSDGMFTTGALPKPPVTLTAALPAEDEEELPQPARAIAASRGKAEMTAIRRMGNLVNVEYELRQPTGWPAPSVLWEKGRSLLSGDWQLTFRRPALYMPVIALASSALHAGDQLFDPFVHRAERVLAQDRALSLVVELEVDPVDGEVPPPLLCPANELSPQPCPRGLRRHRLGLEDVDVPHGAHHRAAALEEVVEPAAAVHVVVGEVELGHPGRGERQVVLGPVPLDELELGYPVDFPGDQVQVAAVDRVQGAFPQLEDLLCARVGAAPVGEVAGLGQVLTLDVQRARFPAVGEPHPALPGHVVADIPDRPDRVLQAQVAHDRACLDHAQHQVRGTDLEQRGRLAHVGVADDHMQPPEPLGVGVRLVPGVDDRPGPGGGRRHAFPDVLGTLADAVHRATRGLQHFPGTADDLPGDQERDQDVGQAAELAMAPDQVVLVAPVG